MGELLILSEFLDEIQDLLAIINSGGTQDKIGQCGGNGHGALFEGSVIVLLSVFQCWFSGGFTCFRTMVGPRLGCYNTRPFFDPVLGRLNADKET
jgi:hypothetical protein